MNLEDFVVDASASNGNGEQPSVNSNTLGTHNNTANAPTDDGDRQSCKFGTHCYRQNPRHRVDMAHPGDVDYEVPNMPPSNEGAPKCEYGQKCYRLNPEHFKNFEHPSNINIQANYIQKYFRGTNSDSGSDICTTDEEDPFAGDGDDSDYVPSEDD